MKLAISGSAGTGKSTLAQNLARNLNIPYIPEHYEPLFDRPGKFNNSTPKVLAEAFNEVLDIKLAEQSKHASFVADRCPIDLLNLWLCRELHCLPAETEMFYNRCRNSLDSYDLFILPPWGVIPLQATPGPEQRQQRVANPWLQLLSHAAIGGMAHMFVPEQKIVYLPDEQPVDGAWMKMVLTRVNATHHDVG